MLKILTVTGLTVAALALGTTASADKPTCNWGQLTSDAIIADDFDQGGHASNQVNPRVGLANVVEPGSLEATCILLSP